MNKDRLVRVISCERGTALNAGRWVVTYEVVGELFKTGAKTCKRPVAVGSVLSESMLW